MANILTVEVSNPAQLLNAGAYGTGAVIRVQSSASSSGTYADVTGTGSTPTITIVATTTAYTGYDPSGLSSTWYRTRYENSGATRTSDWTDPFQVGSAAAEYANLVDLKSRLGITDTTDDTELQQLCTAANALIESFTARILAPITYTAALFDGYDAEPGGRCLVIPTGIRSVSLLEVATNTGASFQTIPSSDYFIRPTVQERDPGWPGTELWITDIPASTDPLPFFPPGFANIRLTGTGGWAAQPDDVIDVALNVAVAKWRARSAAGGDSFTIGSDGERTYERLLSYQDRQTLTRYRLRLPSII